MEVRVPPPHALSFSGHFYLRNVLDAMACSFMQHRLLYQFHGLVVDIFVDSCIKG